MSGDEVSLRTSRDHSSKKTSAFSQDTLDISSQAHSQLPYKPLKVCTAKVGTKEEEAIITGKRFPTAL